MIMTRCGLVMLCGKTDKAQHWVGWWLVAWRHQAIAGTSAAPVYAQQQWGIMVLPHNEGSPIESNWQKVIAGLGDDLAPNRQQAVAWTSDDTVTRLYASLDFRPLLYIMTHDYLLYYQVFITTLLTHWGRVTHICVSKLIKFGSANGLSPGRRQANTWTNAGIW